MTWIYKFADLTEYLTGLSVDPSIIENISTYQDADKRNYFVNIIRQNPQMSYADYLHIDPWTEQQQQDPYTKFEHSMARMGRKLRAGEADLQKWILVQLRKHRGKPVKTDNVAPDPDRAYGLIGEPMMSESYIIGGNTYALSGFNNQSRQIGHDIRGIVDWIRNNPGINLDSYDLETAIHLTEVWHAAIQNEEENVEYGPIDPKSIMYGPEWKDARWQGWTIQKILTPNDLLAEGCQMGHCIKGADFRDKLINGQASFFSLRDPNNSPHATMELDDADFPNPLDPAGQRAGYVTNVEQMEGRGGHRVPPKPEYQALIREWIETLDPKRIPEFEDQGVSLDGLNTVMPRDLDDALQGFLISRDAYGFKTTIDFDANQLYHKVLDLLTGRQFGGEEYTFRPYMAETARTVAQIVWELDKDLLLHEYPRDYLLSIAPEESRNKAIQVHLQNYARHSAVYELKKIIEKSMESALDSLVDIDMSFYDDPKMEDYETEEEWLAAVEKNQEEVETIYTEEITGNLPYAFDLAIEKELEELKIEDPLPLPEAGQPVAQKISAEKNNNWKFLFKSADLSEYLSNQGVTPEVIQFISNLPGKARQSYMQVVKENPQITLDELSANPPPPQTPPPFTGFEEMMSSTLSFDPIIKKWIKVQLKKHRGKPRTVRDTISYTYILGGEEYDLYPNYIEAIFQGIVDWIENNNIDIVSYDFERAFQLSRTWHEQLENADTITQYEETNPASIEYGPEWSKPEWQGWTLQRILTTDDLKAEGNKMNHCVKGSAFCGRLKSSDSFFYSLRDPQNNPHITIEVSTLESGYIEVFKDKKESKPIKIRQISGNSNSEPKPEYKEMIREWSDSMGDNRLTGRSNTDIYELYNIPYGQINDSLERMLSGQDEYGFNTDHDFHIKRLYNLVKDRLGELDKNSRSRGDSMDDYQSETARWISRIAWKMDKEWLRLRPASDHREFHNFSMVEHLRELGPKRIQQKINHGVVNPSYMSTISPFDLVINEELNRLGEVDPLPIGVEPGDKKVGWSFIFPAKIKKEAIFYTDVHHNFGQGGVTRWHIRGDGKWIEEEINDTGNSKTHEDLYGDLEMGDSPARGRVKGNTGSILLFTSDIPKKKEYIERVRSRFGHGVQFIVFDMDLYGGTRGMRLQEYWEKLAWNHIFPKTAIHYMDIGHSDDAPIISWYIDDSGKMFDAKTDSNIGHGEFLGGGSGYSYQACGRIEEGGKASLAFNDNMKIDRFSLINQIVDRFPGVPFLVYDNRIDGMPLQEYWEKLESGDIRIASWNHSFTEKLAYSPAYTDVGHIKGAIIWYMDKKFKLYSVQAWDNYATHAECFKKMFDEGDMYDDGG